MNPTNLYQDVAKSTLEGRALEAHALHSVANKMLLVQNNWDNPRNIENVKQILNANTNLNFWELCISI